MLNVVLVIHDDADALPFALPSLARALPDDHSVVFIDQGSQDNSREHVQAFIRKHGGELVALDDRISLPDAAAIAKQSTCADFALPITVQDRLHRTSLANLADALPEMSADTIVLGGGWWLTGAETPIAYPDANRTNHIPALPSAADVMTLFPDPRRLLHRDRAFQGIDPNANPVPAWQEFENTVGQSRTIQIFPEPVLLQPMPAMNGARWLDSIAGYIETKPSGEALIWLERCLAWSGDAIMLSCPSDAPAILEAASRALVSLPAPLREMACASPGPAGTVLDAVSRGQNGEGLARLALIFQARTDRCIAAVAHDYAALRRDLDMALPGPEYLMDLYARLRGL